MRTLYPATYEYRVIGEHLADFVSDEDFADVYHREGAPAISPARLAMVTLFQFMENLSDRQAASMVVSRMDWKYALHLPVLYQGFDHTVLHDFRERLLNHEAGARVFGRLLARLKELGLVRARGRQRTDSFAVLTMLRNLTRLELVMDTLRLALCALARADANWLRVNIAGEWLDTYGERPEHERLVKETGEKGKQEIRRLAIQTGQDGLLLLSRLDSAGVDEKLRDLPEVETLRAVWAQQFRVQDKEVEWPERLDLPGAEIIETPHDPDVRHSEKCGKDWDGYKAHVTETVEEDLPRIITQVQTTLATDADSKALNKIQDGLEENQVVPAEQLVDSAYVSGKNLAHSEKRGIELTGPMQAESSPQARMEGGVTLSQFEVDIENRTARCPGGCQSARWSTRYDQQKGEISHEVSFAASDCGKCPLYAKCVTSKKEGPQGRHLRVSEHYARVRQRRQEQETEGFKQRYRSRAGIEASLSQMARGQGFRMARYVGLARVSLQHQFTGAATNLRRAARWIAGEKVQSHRENNLKRLLAGA